MNEINLLENAQIPQVSIDSLKTFTEYQVFAKALREGAIAATEVVKAWDLFCESQENIKLELSKMTIKELKKYAGHTWSNANKADIVKKVFGNLVSSFSPPGHSWYPMQESYGDSVRRNVLKWTDEIIQAGATERNQRIEEWKKSLSNPETLSEFETFVSYRGEDKLSEEQLVKYDQLLASVGRQRRIHQAEYKATVTEFGELPEGVELAIAQTIHTIKKHDLFVVSLNKRVEKSIYEQLNIRAKIHGGKYSSYDRDGAIPGWQFTDQAAAIEFKMLGKVQGSDRVETWKEQRQRKAVAHILEVAQSLRVQAKGTLAQERKDNTHRRARIASSIEATACSQLQLVRTMERIAEAIASNEVTFIDRFMYMVEFEQVETMLHRGQWTNWRTNKIPYRESALFIDEDVNHVEYPYPSVNKENLLELAQDLLNTSGVKLAAKRLLKKCANCTHEYRVEFKYPDEIEDLRSLVERAIKFNKYRYRAENIKSSLLEYDRMIRLDLHNIAELRTALREYLKFRGQKPNLDPVRILRRQLVGNKIPGYFPTPPELVEKLISLAGIEAGMSVCDPMAGSGHILEQLRLIDDISVYGVEINYTLREILKAIGFQDKLIGNDFFDVTQTFDRFVANPDFTDGKDAIAVRRMYDLLNPGGRIVVIVSESCFFSSRFGYPEFRLWLDTVKSQDYKLPPGSFKDGDVPTGVNCRIIVVDK